MLVLNRKPGQRIVMPSLELALSVISVEGNRVRLGVTAPKRVAVHRQEAVGRLCKSSHGGKS